MSYKCDSCGDDDKHFLCLDCVAEKEENAFEEGREQGEKEKNKKELTEQNL